MNSIIFTIISKDYEREINRAAERKAERRANGSDETFIPNTGDALEKMICAGEKVWGKRPAPPGACGDCCEGCAC